MLAGRNRFEHELARDAVAADQLDHDVDVGIRDHRACIVHDLHLVADQCARTLRVEVRHHRDFDAAARAALDFARVALQHFERAAADGADAEQADLDGFHGLTFSRKTGLRRLFRLRHTLRFR